MRQEDPVEEIKEKALTEMLEFLQKTEMGTDVRLVVCEAWTLTFVCQNVSKAYRLSNLIMLKKAIDKVTVGVSVQDDTITLSTSLLGEREKIKDWAFRIIDDLGYQIETYQLIPEGE